MNNNYDYLETNLCEITEDYGFFPAFEDGRIIWNIAVFPKAGKKEKFCATLKELNIPLVSDCKKAPRINKVKECFVFDRSRFPKITAMIEKTVQTR